MKKRIKIKKQLLKEDDTEKRRVERDRTQRAARGSSGEEYMSPTEKKRKYGPLKGDPTDKVSRQELEAALAGAPMEKGIMQKVTDYLYRKLFSPKDSEPTDVSAAPESAEVPGGGKFGGIPGFAPNPQQKSNIDKAVSSVERGPSDRQTQDAMRFGKKPDYFDDDPDYLKDFRNLQEIAKRHFKKRD